MRRRCALAVIVSAVVAAGLAESISVIARRRGRPDPAAADTSGTTATRLADGRWLIAGGRDSSGRPTGATTLWDPAAQVAVGLRPMLYARAGHTATILSDGRVLIVGGVSPAGDPVTVPERFDPATETFEALAMASTVARAGHTATLLTDGRVFVTGGRSTQSDGRGDAEVWNVATGRVTAVAGRASTRFGTATLGLDGRVRVVGTDPAGRATADLFDPATNALQPLTAPAADDGGALFVAEQRPANGATDVPLDVTIALRLSHAAQPDSITDQAVVVSGPGGAVSSRVVPAEGGRLVFVRPFDALLADAIYTITVAGVHDDNGRALTMTPVRFTTAKAPAVTEPDLESWWPDPSGRDWATHRPPSPWQSLPPLRADPGVTAVAGQVLTLDGRPLSGVTLAIDDDRAETDRTGRFVLRLTSGASGHRELRIDGRTASRPGRTYGLFEYGLRVASGETAVLPFTIWMPRLDTAHAVRLVSPTAAETLVTTPRIPGLELHLPANTRLRAEDGSVATELGITPIPVDRPPFPLPANTDVPVYFTIQPGGAYIETTGPGPRGGWLVYPNYGRHYAGKRTQFFHYDPGDRGWYVYGVGTVTADLSQVVPDATTRIYELTGAMINSGPSPPVTATPPGDCRQAGDPVDLGTGLLIVEHTDLDVSDVLPLSLTRTYRPNDPEVRPFGIGTNHLYGIFLWSARQYQEADLVLPDGGRVHYVRTSPGTGWTDAVFESAVTPTAFYKSIIRWNGNGWDLTLKDGTVYVFGENAPLQAIRDRNGNQITLTRSNGQGGNILRVTSPNGRWLGFTYDGAGRITRAQDNAGRSVQYAYDGSGRLATVTDAAGGATTYAYDASHRMIAVTNPRRVTIVANEYDANGRVSRQVHADGGVYRFTYTSDASGRVAQTDLTDPRAIVRRTLFNSAGYCTSDALAVGRPEEQTTTWTRDPASNLILATTDPLTRRTAYTFDGNGNRLTLTRLDGTADAVTTRYTYEPLFNQVATITDPLGHVTSFSYDAHGNSTRLADPLQHASTFTYRPDGQVSRASDPLGRTTAYGYTGGDLTAVTDALGRTTRKFLDVLGRPVARTDALGSQYTYRYDALDRVVQFTDPLGGVVSPSWDEEGNLLAVGDPRSSTTRFAYTDMDRLSERTDSLARVERSEYDPNGNLVRFTDRKGQVSEFQYDGLNRRISAAFDTAGGSSRSTVAYSYDAGNRLVRVTDSGAGTIDFVYDALDRLIAETTPQGAVAYTYDDDGRRSTMTVAGQPTVAYEYDAAERLTRIAQGGALIGFTYDEANRRTSLTLPNGIAAAYEYDAASQLTRIAYEAGGAPLGDITYSYDAAGNRVSIGGSWARVSLPQPVASAIYDAANQLTQWAGRPFAYDANGNLAWDGATSYLWNARDELVALSGGRPVTFAYDGLGRRWSATIDGTTTISLYDWQNVIQQSTTGQTVTANFLTGLGVDETFLRIDASGTNTLLADALNSTLAEADDSAVVRTQYTFEPFGATTALGPFSRNVQQFTGRENDGTALYFYRARFYDPESGRFISEDPIGLDAGDINPYAYVSNAPTMFVDPSGLDRTNWDFGANGRWGPRNGNWGGRDWSGGWVSSRHDGASGPLPPTDSADRCYMNHDNCYGTCRDRTDCNRDLVRCLERLPDDPRRWPEPPPPGTDADSSRFRRGAIIYFGAGARLR